MEATKLIFFICVGGFTLAAATFDSRTRKVPNWLTVPVLLGGLLFHTVAGALDGGFPGAAKGFGWAAGGFAVGFGILFLLWMVGGTGGGDVKLMGALGAWLGPYLALIVFVVSGLIVMVYTVFAMAVFTSRRGVAATQKRYLRQSATDRKSKGKSQAGRSTSRRRLLPLGVPVAMATWAVLATVELAPVLLSK